MAIAKKTTGAGKKSNDTESPKPPRLSQTDEPVRNQVAIKRPGTVRIPKKAVGGDKLDLRSAVLKEIENEEKKTDTAAPAEEKAIETAKAGADVFPVIPSWKKIGGREIKPEQKPPADAVDGLVKAVAKPFMPVAAKTETTGADLPPEQAVKRPLHIYRKISVSFIIVALGLLGIISYYSLVKVVITVEPKSEKINNNLVVDIFDENNTDVKDGSVVGIVRQIEVEQSKEFSATGANILGEEAIGTVKIVNNYTKNQPLVASTRLLSADNKLFRIKDTVNVPANGSAEVAIYADKPSADMAIGPSKFTIPGLWAGLQDKIYAESSAPVVYQQKAQKIIQQIDIDNAINDLKNSLAKQAESEVGANFKSKYDQALYKIDDDSVASETDAKSGEEKDSFTVTVKAKVTVVAFQDEAIKKITEQKLISALPENKKLLEFDKDKITYNLSSFDVDNGTASVDSNFEGLISFKDDAQIIDKNKLVGLTGDQLNEYLASLPEISGFKVEFFPEFIKKVPNLADRIEIKVTPAK